MFRLSTKWCLALLLTLVCCTTRAADTSKDRPVNVVFFLADDVNKECYGAPDLGYHTRHEMLLASGCGFGHLALSSMAQQASAEQPQAAIPARAKRIIFLFKWGGPSHIDFFDPKPVLNARSGEMLRGGSVGGVDVCLGTLMGSPFEFSQHGDSGVWMNDLLPEIARHADKMCVVRSMHTEGNAHGEALLRLHTGQANLVRPSVGAWVSYGLGSENENLPSFITISPPRGHGGAQNYGNAFLPAKHQGTAIGSAEIPISKAKILNLTNPSLGADSQRQQLQLLQSINQQHLQSVQHDQRIEGLIANYELAFRMQSTIPSILDLASETKETMELYGIDSEPTDNFGRQCLLARKFAEQGVRYIQVSTNYTWDHHKQVKDGRNHHPKAFTMWMAGGGCKPGLTHGVTDEFGYRPIKNPVHMHDLHATLLHMLGLDHETLTYRHAGRDFRLTDVYGNIVHDILA